MAEHYLFFNSTATDRRKHQASDIADYWQSFLSTGLINEGTHLGLQVTANNDTTITIKTGRGLIFGHLYRNTADLLKTVEGAHATLSRIDRIILRYDNTINSRFIKAFVLKGEPSENPVAPALTREGDIYELSLAQIHVVAGKSFIEQSDIIDERLDESLCGLATALGHVPTDVYNAEFEAYMQQIAQEWQNWYNTMYDAAFVTQDEYKANKRDVGRQLANLNAIADIDNRAIGNTGKFYDLFDGRNDMSIANLNKTSTITKSSTDATSVVLEVLNTSEFKVGEEVTIIGLETMLSDVSVFARKIININSELSQIEINEQLGTTLLDGTYVTRSTIDNGHISNKVVFEDFSNLVKQPTEFFGQGAHNSGVSLSTISATANGKFMTNGRDIAMYDEQLEKYVIKTNSTANEAMYTLYGDNVLAYYLWSSTLNAEFKSVSLLSDNGDGTYTEQIIYTVPRTDNVTGVNSYGTVYDEYSKKVIFYRSESSVNRIVIWSVDTVTNEVISYPSVSTGMAGGGAFISLKNDVVAIFRYSNKMITFYKLNHTAKTIQSIISFNATDLFGASIDPRSLIKLNDNRLLVLSSSSKLIWLDIIYNGDGTVTITKSPILDAPFPSASSPSISRNGFYLVNGNSIYLIDGYSLNLIATSLITPVAFKPFSNFLVTYNTTDKFKYVTGSKEHVLAEAILRYDFNQPITNLAGWLITNEQPTSVQAALSLVNANEPESYQPLTVTQNGNEYEFLETQNLYTKDKATLKLTIEGTANLNKLLGAVE